MKLVANALRWSFIFSAELIYPLFGKENFKRKLHFLRLTRRSLSEQLLWFAAKFFHSLSNIGFCKAGKKFKRVE